MKGLLLALVGFIICVAIIGIVSVLSVAMLWWMFRNNLDFEDLINSEEWEDNHE